MKYEIYQIQVPDSVYDQVNALGHAEAAKQFPVYHAHQQTSLFGEYEPEFFKHYAHVATVTILGGSNLDDVFRILNTINIDVNESLVRHLPMHSLSVGDIVRDGYGNFYLCAPIGWESL